MGRLLPGLVVVVMMMMMMKMKTKQRNRRPKVYNMWTDSTTTEICLAVEETD
jgi:hypothetical protein